jgi:D-sedoheptulose 7-phosphate isomerase
MDRTKELKIVEIKANILKTVNSSLTIENINRLTDASRCIIETLKGGGTVYVCGNGGSAADADHFVAEMVGRLRKKDRPAYRFESLTSNTATITALGNDKGYENIFVEQLRGRYNHSKDLLIAISTSGNSSNVVKAAKFCQEDWENAILGFVIGLTGNNDKCDLKFESDILLTVKSDETERIQEVHKMYLHILAQLVEEGMTND